MHRNVDSRIDTNRCLNQSPRLLHTGDFPCVRIELVNRISCRRAKLNVALAINGVLSREAEQTRAGERLDFASFDIYPAVVIASENCELKVCSICI